MFVKKLLSVAIAVFVLSSAGCCRMWENWCHRPTHYQGAPAPYCPPAQPPCVCPPGYSGYAPQAPGMPMPVPPVNSNWQRCP
jgi:hypothetical protein